VFDRCLLVAGVWQVLAGYRQVLARCCKPQMAQPEWLPDEWMMHVGGVWTTMWPRVKECSCWAWFTE
jgi:hypothetical protein